MNSVILQTTKYDGAFHSWAEYKVLETAEWGWLLYLPAGQAIATYRGNQTTRYHSFRWMWHETWWDANLAFTPDGKWALWYCNVATPPAYEDGVLYAQDLDLDVIWDRQRGIYLDDEEELEQHAMAMSYPPDLVRRIWQSAHEIEARMHSRTFPFIEEPETLTLAQFQKGWGL
jgi:protein associated with RNAse G/E